MTTSMVNEAAERFVDRFHGSLRYEIREVMNRMSAKGFVFAYGFDNPGRANMVFRSGESVEYVKYEYTA